MARFLLMPKLYRRSGRRRKKWQGSYKTELQNYSKNHEGQFSVTKDRTYCLCPSEAEMQQLQNRWTEPEDTLYLKTSRCFSHYRRQNSSKILKLFVPRLIKTYILRSRSCNPMYVRARIWEHILCTSVCTSGSLFSKLMHVLCCFHLQTH